MVVVYSTAPLLEFPSQSLPLSVKPPRLDQPIKLPLPHLPLKPTRMFHFLCSLSKSSTDNLFHLQYLRRFRHLFRRFLRFPIDRFIWVSPFPLSPLIEPRKLTFFLSRCRTVSSPAAPTESTTSDARPLTVTPFVVLAGAGMALLF